MKVKSCMTQNVRSIKPSESLCDAASLMWDADCGTLPVVDENKKLTGIVTDRDIMMAGFRKGRPLKDITVAETMSKDLISVNADDDLSKAEELMQTEQVRRLPVVDAKKNLVGILSINDIALAYHRDSGREIKADEVANTLASISRHKVLSHRVADGSLAR